MRKANEEEEVTRRGGESVRRRGGVTRREGEEEEMPTQRDAKEMQGRFIRDARETHMGDSSQLPTGPQSRYTA